MDHIQEYSKSLCYHGLMILLHRDAIREGDGPRMINYWKHNLLQYLDLNHQKYLIYTVRLLTAMNGGVSERLREQIVWNRTVNHGGPGNNISMDLMIEFLNKAFKGIKNCLLLISVIFKFCHRKIKNLKIFFTF